MSQALIPVETLFDEYQRITLPSFFSKLFKNGCEIYFKKLRPKGIDTTAEGVTYQIWDADGFIAIADSVMFEKGMAIRAKKMFFN